MKNDRRKFLNKYSKEVLIEYIIKVSFLRTDRMESDIKEIHKNIEFERLMKRSDEITEEMKTCMDKGIEGRIKWHKLMEEDRAIHKKIDKLLDINNLRS